MDYTDFLIRISVSFGLSLLVGLERQIRGRAVGLRTSVLVSIGTFMFVSFSFETVPNDISRIASQVVSGIGFLGAGVILKDNKSIKGLNTAATLWCNAAIGVLCAGGFLAEASIGTGFILFCNVVLRYITKKINLTHKKIEVYDDYVLTVFCTKKDSSDVKQKMMDLINKECIELQNIEINANELDKVKMVLTFKFLLNNSNVIESIVKNLSEDNSVLSFSMNKIDRETIEILDDEI